MKKAKIILGSLCIFLIVIVIIIFNYRLNILWYLTFPNKLDLSAMDEVYVIYQDYSELGMVYDNLDSANLVPLPTEDIEFVKSYFENTKPYPKYDRGSPIVYAVFLFRSNEKDIFIGVDIMESVSIQVSPYGFI